MWTQSRQWFLKYDTKAHATKEKINKLNFTIIKIFSVSKNTMKKVKRQLPGENIYTFDNIKFIYKYPEYIKLIQFNSKNTTRLKN